MIYFFDVRCTFLKGYPRNFNSTKNSGTFEMGDNQWYGNIHGKFAMERKIVEYETPKHEPLIINPKLLKDIRKLLGRNFRN